MIRSALIYIKSKTNRGVLVTRCNSHRVTLNCTMRDTLKKGMHYKQDVSVSLREYGNMIDGCDQAVDQ